MSWLDALFLKYRTVRTSGVDVPQRSSTNYIGMIVTDDPVNDQTNVTNGGATTPTGTGVVHVVAGVEAGTGSLGAALQGLRTNAAGTDLEWAAVASLTASAPVNVTKAAAAVGTDADAARADHKHDVTTAAASANPPGTSSAEGTGASLARSDHTHALAAFGTGAGTFCQGNDSRLSDSRAPNGSASGSLGGTYPSPTVKQIDGTAGVCPIVATTFHYTGDAKCLPDSFIVHGSTTNTGTVVLATGTLGEGVTIISAMIGATKSDKTAGCGFVELATFMNNGGSVTQQDTTQSSGKQPAASGLALAISNSGTTWGVIGTGVTGVYTWGGKVDVVPVIP